ncbi:Type II secretion system protein D [Andreprevotia sp. IGB-42]|uniref:secretin N-terminal domain-containing protein n=1 Tax=Andreprevotia sp. IGB-42 TaxID=2497473 RepID=UPI00135C331A|nr:secretin N-terminal domain-containing protein [Andreprevotia sp. IGB-42]KAF0812918.1 Type II secretion system protein D [Andreprevotia sp. IGB-42]
MKRALTMSLIAAGLISGCAAERARKSAVEQIQQGSTPQGLATLQEALKNDPDDIALRATYERQRDDYIGRLQKEADDGRMAGTPEGLARALVNYQQILAYAPGNLRAKEGLRQIEGGIMLDSKTKYAQSIKDTRPDEALDIVQQIIAENPRATAAITLKTELEARKARESSLKPALAQALKSPISLQFRDQPIFSVFDIISRIGKVNFIFDRDVPSTLRTTIYARDTTVEDVINLLLTTNQLDKKILNDNTILIYPKRPDKDRDYKDLVMRTFYLNNADPKQVLAMLKQMVKTRDVYIDERLSMIVMRDTPDAVAVAERLIAAQDLPQSEVVLDVEVLEVTSSDLLNMGIKYPSSVSATVGGFAGGTTTAADGSTTSTGAFTPGKITLEQLSSINKGNVLVNLGDPTITANFLRTKSNTNVLANPKIRVKNRDKAKILIGDRVPVITSTVSNGVTTESVAYQDVGLTLNVEPLLTQDSDISIKVTLEMSNITDKSETKQGSVVYTIGTRRAETNMTARDGETQVLAGLLNRTETGSGSSLPGLGELPILDRIFGTKQTENKRTELMLMITPRIVRNLQVPSGYVTNFNSGTDGLLTTEPLRLRDASTVNVNSNGSGGAAPAAPAPAPLPPPVVVEPVAIPAPVEQPKAETQPAVTRGAGMGRR